MQRIFLGVIALTLSSITFSSADDIPATPCTASAEIRLDDAPRFRLGDPRRTEKSQAGINPLQIKFIGVTATAADLVLLVRTHDSLEKFWDYAERRRAAGAPLRTGENTPLRGLNFQFLVYPAARPENGVRGAVWLEYAGPKAPEAKTLIEKDPGFSAGFGFPSLEESGGFQANISTPVDVLLTMNEVEVRMPLTSFDIQPGDDVKIKFRQGEVTVCLPTTEGK